MDSTELNELFTNVFLIVFLFLAYFLSNLKLGISF